MHSSAVPTSVRTRNSYGFTAAQMSKIARNLHRRARGKELRAAIAKNSAGSDRIRLIAIENMKGAFGNEGALRFYSSLNNARQLAPDFRQRTA